MDYLRRTAAVRKNLREKFPWAQSLVCVAYRHPAGRPDEGIAGHIARYAQGDDYHDALDRPLEDLETFIRDVTLREGGRAAETRGYIDTGPILEKNHAAAAGLGWVGKNSLLLNESLGSYLLLAEIVTDLPLPADRPAADRCGACTRCMEACPTGAIVSPYVLDATRCISYHTIETKTAIPSDIGEQLHGNLFGCDICQEVCPWNRPIPADAGPATAIEAAFRTREAYRSIQPGDLAAMPPDEYQRIFRKSPLKRPGLDKLRESARRISGPASPETSAGETTRPEAPAPTLRSSEPQNTPSAGNSKK